PDAPRRDAGLDAARAGQDDLGVELGVAPGVLEPQRVAGREEGQLVDLVLELADVTGPVVARQDAHHLRVDAQLRGAVLACDLPEEMIDEERNVVAAVAERGRLDADDVEAEVEILAKPLLLD